MTKATDALAALAARDTTDVAFLINICMGVVMVKAGMQMCQVTKHDMNQLLADYRMEMLPFVDPVLGTGHALKLIPKEKPDAQSADPDSP